MKPGESLAFPCRGFRLLVTLDHAPEYFYNNANDGE